MRTVLGIDAAWTENEPSGVALVQGEGDSWRLICAAPSYEAFLAARRGINVDWQTGRFAGGIPNIPELISAAECMAKARLCVVAIDMPLATVPITARRAADSEISRAFGSRGCSTHSPNAMRPGQLGVNLLAQLQKEGFPLATKESNCASSPCTIEVYPHPALLTLLSLDYRLPYKLSRSSKYWPDKSVSERIIRIVDGFEQINTALGKIMGGPPLSLPPAGEVPTLSALKRYEDALDAIVCAWVGLRFTQGSVAPYGDKSAVIWVP